jgi:signal transduction histidine kinase
MSLRHIRAPVIDALLVGLSLLDAAINLGSHAGLAAASAVVAAFALFLRRRLPLLVLLVTLPALLLTDATAASLVALYTLASLTRRRAVLIAGAIAVTACHASPWQLSNELHDQWSLTHFGYTLAKAAAAVFLGQLVQVRRDLSLRLAEISEVREHERLLIAQTIVAKERAQLAREMHDVVSHQVSLIAVRSGALQVSTKDPTVKEAASTIRRLSVQTLDELRHMVSLLRASGSLPTELTPQPTLAQLEQLVASSGVEATLDMDLPDDLPPPVQRAIYRTVQEALTNVRKHAPGANATVRIHRNDHTVLTTITNAAATRTTLALPSAKQGLIGLRQRADTLGGELQSGPTPDGGYRLHLALPAGTSRAVDSNG